MRTYFHSFDNSAELNFYQEDASDIEILEVFHDVLIDKARAALANDDAKKALAFLECAADVTDSLIKLTTKEEEDESGDSDGQADA